MYVDTKYSVYIVTCVTNAKQYVGITKNLKKRWGEHKRKISKYQALHKAIDKYGIENFVFSHIADAFNLESAYAIEVMLIKEHNTKSPNGYNLTDGGDGVNGKVWTDSERKAKSISMHEYMANLSAEEKHHKFSSFLGKKHPDDVKKKISDSNLGKNLGKKGMSGKSNPMYGMTGDKNPYYGKTHSDEAIAKMKAAWVIRKAKEFA